MRQLLARESDSSFSIFDLSVGCCTNADRSREDVRLRSADGGINGQAEYSASAGDHNLKAAAGAAFFHSISQNASARVKKAANQLSSSLSVLALVGGSKRQPQTRARNRRSCMKRLSVRRESDFCIATTCLQCHSISLKTISLTLPMGRWNDSYHSGGPLI